MLRHLQIVGRGWLFAFATALAVAGLASSASAHTGLFQLFNYCPTSNPETFKCVTATVYGGEVVLGKKTTPIVNPVTLQAGYTETERARGLSRARLSTVIPATNGVTLSKTPEPVPGGLLGLVPPASSPPAIKQLASYYSAHNLAGVNAVVELARPAAEARISEFNLLDEEELAMYLPVKVHLENQFLGSSCYIGSSSSPISWELTTSYTEGFWQFGLHGNLNETRVVPLPNKPIQGVSGFAALYEQGLFAGVDGNELVDNRWSAPAATGCGGTLAPIVDPLIDAAVGLPSPAGRNTTILRSNVLIAAGPTVAAH